MARFQGETLLILLLGGLILAALVFLGMVGWLAFYDMQQNAISLL